MNSFNNLNVKSAVQDRGKFDLSLSHLTTLEFGQIVPLANWDCIPGDKFSVNMNIFSRCAPMVLPTYGDAAIKTTSTFVPYHQLADDFDAFVAGKTVYQSRPVVPRTMTIGQMVTFLSSPECASSVTGSAAYDFVTWNGSTATKYKLNAHGKYCYKVLRALGYQIPSKVTNGNTDKLNALPLLAFFKAYNDYMSQAALYDSSLLTKLLKDVRDGDITALTAANLSTAFKNIKLLYSPDYFTTAWNTPEAPISGVNGSGGANPSMLGIGTSDEIGNLDDYTHSPHGLVANTDYSGPAISQNDLDVLKSFDAWARRNSYSGTRTMEMLYSRYGIKVSDTDIEYSQLIGSSSQPVQIGDITATASTDNAVLGDYAGKGIVSGQDGFNYSCQDFGMLIVLGYVTVKPIYADGFDRSVLKTTCLEYYQPEYDGIGVNAIPEGELATFCHVDNATVADNNNWRRTFGFTERYNEYRTAKDKVTGDMCLPRYVDAQKWHFNRDFSSINASGLMAQSAGVMEFDGSQYNKIFSITSSDEDKFYLTCRFNCMAVRNIKSTSGVLRLGEGAQMIHRNGNLVS